MSVLASAIKNGEIAIACDTQCSFGSLIVDSRSIHNHNKLYVIKGYVIGVIGWSAVAGAMENLMDSKSESINLISIGPPVRVVSWLSVQCTQRIIPQLQPLMPLKPGCCCRI